MITAEQIEKIRNSGPIAIAGVYVSEILDSLDACETERDRIRTEVASLSAQVAEVPELTDAILDLACGPDISGKADMHSAAFRIFSRTQYRRGWEDLASRLVPTPPQAAPGAVAIRDPDDDDWDAFGFQQGTKAEVLRVWNRALATCKEFLQAPQPLQPEERRVGPDEVVVGREEWEAVQEFADLIVPIRDNLSGISWIGKLSDVFAAYDRWYAVRTSAQAHNGEGANNVG